MQQPIKTYFFTFCFFISSLVANAQFITTWKTDNPGSSATNQITIPTFTGETYNYTVDWGDGATDTGVTGNITHTYANPGTYTVTITGTFPRIYFDGGGFFGSNTDYEKLLTIEQWGNNAWTSMVKAFSGCVNLRINATDTPNLAAVTDMTEMFRECTSLNDNINSWDVSSVTNMNGLFRDAAAFNQPLDLWNVSAVTDMAQMFRFAIAFNQNINSWNVSNVTTMAFMFNGAQAFNQPLNNWVVSSVISMDYMFTSAAAFNQNITGWDVSNVTLMRSMFSGALAFNQNISTWDISSLNSLQDFFRNAAAFNQDLSAWNIVVGNITDMEGVFDGATAFNQDLSGWDVSKVTNMRNMFANTSYNLNITGWNVGSVTNFAGMFQNNPVFNQDISGWNVSSAIDMRSMFQDATSFNQNLGNWNVSNVSLMFNMLNNSGLTIANYDNLLIGWSGLTLKTNVNFGANGLVYCSGEAGRNILTGTYNWFINDAGLGCIKMYEGPDTSAPEIMNGQTTPIDYGSVNLGGSKSLSFTFENRIATPITNLAISITGNGEFTPVSPPTVIATGSFIVVNITFSAPVLGSFTELVSISSDNFTTPFTFPVTGVVTATTEPEIKVFDGPAANGTEIIDGSNPGLFVGPSLRGSSTTSQITLINLGSAPLVVSSISVSGTVFSLNPTTPFTLAVGSSQTINITLDGAVAGFFTETLTINNNDLDEAVFDFVIEGEIFGPEIAVFDGVNIYSDPQISNGQTTPINLGESPLGTDLTYKLAVANMGIVDLSITNISISGTVFSVSPPTPITIIRVIDGNVSSDTLTIVLDGTVAGKYNETITITSDDDVNTIFTFTISGAIVDPNARKMYWTETTGKQINRSNQDGTSFQQFHSEVSFFPIGIALDTINNIVYWTNNYGQIRKGEISAGSLINVTDFINDGLDAPRAMGGLSLDVANGKIYWASTYDEAIKSADLLAADPNTTISVITNVPNPRSVAIDPGNSKLYYTTNFDNSGTSDNIGALHEINIDGTNDITLSSRQIAGTNYFYTDVKLDLTNNIIYWSGANDDIYAPVGEIYSASISDVAGTTTSFTTINASPWGIDLDIAGGKVYWIDKEVYMTAPVIARANLDGSLQEPLHTGYTNITSPSFIALDVIPPGNCTVLPTADAGVDQNSCPGDAVSLSGAIGGSATSAVWSASGDGSFANPNTLTTTYTPGTADIAAGSVTLTLTTVGSGTCTPATDQLIITINQPITAANQSGSLAVNETITIDVTNGSILNTGDVITTTLLTNPQKGTATINADGSIAYTAQQGNVGSDTFDFQLCNQCNLCSSATVTITILNSPPSAQVNPTSTAAGSPVTIDVIANITDINGNIDLSSLKIVVPPSSGANAYFNADGSLTVDYSGISFVGTDQLSIEVCDTDGVCITFEVAIDVLPPAIEVFNVVSANGDGKHDYLEIANIEFFPNNTVIIMNRWGDIVYETTGYDNNTVKFEGISKNGKGELPPGTYFYVINLGTGNQEYSGFLELRR